VQTNDFETEQSQTGLVLYKKEKEVIDEVLIKALRAKIRLSMAQAIRLLIRRCDLKNLSTEDFAEAANDNKELRRKRHSKSKHPKKSAQRADSLD